MPGMFNRLLQCFRSLPNRPGKPRRQSLASRTTPLPKMGQPSHHLLTSCGESLQAGLTCLARSTVSLPTRPGKPRRQNLASRTTPLPKMGQPSHHLPASCGKSLQAGLTCLACSTVCCSVFGPSLTALESHGGKALRLERRRCPKWANRHNTCSRAFVGRVCRHL